MLNSKLMLIVIWLNNTTNSYKLEIFTRERSSIKTINFKQNI